MPTPRLASRQFAAWLGLALLLKALVPAGWMPVSEDGAVRLAPCGAWAKAAAAAPPGHQDATSHHGAAHEGAARTTEHGEHEEERQTADQPCSFAGAGFAWTTAHAPSLTERVRPAPLPSPPPPEYIAIGRGLAAPPPPATGPPLLA